MRDLRITQSITSNRNEDSLNRYLADINQINLISVQEEILLAQKIKEGDKAAEHKLVTANLRFVVSCAKKYQHMGVPLQDLVNEGNIGLIRAARMFDETKGFKFISYAVWWIRQAMIQAMNEYVRMIRVPMNQQLGMTSIRQESMKMEQQLEREPTLDELKEALGKSTEQLTDCIQSNARIKYLEDELPGSVSDNNTLLEYVPHQEETITETQIKSEAVKSIVAKLLNNLHPREQKILIMAYGLNGRDPMDGDQIAERLNLSRERIRQLMASSIKKLRALPKPCYIREFV